MLNTEHPLYYTVDIKQSPTAKQSSLPLQQIVDKAQEYASLMCAMVKSRYIGDGHPTFNRNPCNGYINPYYWVDDHPLLYGNNGSWHMWHLLIC